MLSRSNFIGGSDRLRKVGNFSRANARPRAFSLQWLKAEPWGLAGIRDLASPPGRLQDQTRRELVYRASQFHERGQLFIGAGRDIFSADPEIFPKKYA
jgi:hypothetical protein